MKAVKTKITVHAVITREDGSKEELDLLLDHLFDDNEEK